MWTCFKWCLGEVRCCSGMIVFKLERERPAYATSGGVLYYVKDRYLRSYDYATQRDSPLITVRPIPDFNLPGLCLLRCHLV